MKWAIASLAAFTVLAAVVVSPAESQAPAAVARAECGSGSHPETGMQGRLSAADIESGYASTGITCNTELVSRFGAKGTLPIAAGGYKVFRYIDQSGHECAYFDSALAFPLNLYNAAGNGLGVFVLDMSDPTSPVKTANLLTPAMLSPHESMSLNAERGLLAAASNFAVHPGIVDIYDLKDDCRHPVLKSSTPFGPLGHEGNFSPDGNTFWVASGGRPVCAGLGPATLTAIDVSDPGLPRVIWTSTDLPEIHGFSISDEGTRLYAADLGPQGSCNGQPGLRIFDVSQVQSRFLVPAVSSIAFLSWDTGSIPQMTIPVTINGTPYLVQIDELARGFRAGDPSAPVGAARIIDITDETRPFVASDIRLEVHQPENIAAIAGDPGASFGYGGYTGHYCAVPRRHDPELLACSFILSGMRAFDIRDPLRPREIAYFNAPIPPANAAEQALSSVPLNAAFAMSAPAFATERHEIWYSDGNFGFFNVRVTNNAWPEGQA